MRVFETKLSVERRLNGAIWIVDDSGYIRSDLPARIQPDLFAVLLKAAGAVFVEFERRTRADGSWYLEQIAGGAVSEGKYILVRVPE